jgi:hypothetical protein
MQPPLKFLIVLTSGAAAIAVALGGHVAAEGSDLLAMISNALGAIG